MERHARHQQAHQQQQQQTCQLVQLPAAAYEVLRDTLSTFNPPGMCVLALVSRALAQAARQHPAHTMQLHLGEWRVWLQQQPQDMDEPLSPAAEPSPAWGAAEEDTIPLTSDQLFDASRAELTRLLCASSWIRKYGQALKCLSIQLSRDSRFLSTHGQTWRWRDVEALHAAGLADVMDAMMSTAAAAAAAAAAATAPQAAAAGVAAAAAASAATPAMAVPSTADIAAADGVAPGAVAEQAAAGAVSAPQLQLQALRLPCLDAVGLGRMAGLLEVLRNLRQLRLDGLQYSFPREEVQLLWGALKQLTQLTALQVMVEDNGKVAGQNVGTLLRSCPRSLALLVLEPADSEGAPLAALDVMDLAPFTQLQQLVVPDCLYTSSSVPVAEAVQQLVKLTQLTALDFGNVLGADGSEEELLLQLPSLRAVGTLADLCRAPPSKAALELLASMPRLRRLTIAEPAEVEILQQLQRLTQLEDLTIGTWWLCHKHAAAASWRDALGALAWLQRLRAPLWMLLGQDGNDSPLPRLQQLRVVHATHSETLVSTPRDDDMSLQQLLQALAQLQQLQEVHVDGVRMQQMPGVQLMAYGLLSGVAVTLTSHSDATCCVVEEVLS